MVKFQLSYPAAPLDYPTLGFIATADGAILDGTLFTPDLEIPPDARWSVYGGGSAETSINRYATPSVDYLNPIPEVTAGYLLAYDTDANTYVPTSPTDVLETEAWASSLSASTDAIVSAAVEPKLTGVAQNTEPDPSVGVWVDTGSTVPAPTADTNTLAMLVLVDNCTRSDSSSTAGSPTIGPAYTADRGTWGISSNQIYMATHDAIAAANDTLLIETGTADHIIQAKLTANAPGLGVRVSSAANGFITNLTALYQRATENNGSPIATFSSAFIIGDTMRIVALGTSIKVYRQASSAGAFTQVASVTSSFNATVTKACLRTSTAASFDDILVHSLLAA